MSDVTNPWHGNVDRFGLPLDWRELGETAEQKVYRILASLLLAHDVYEALVRTLGPKGAKRAMRRPLRQKRGRKKGKALHPEQNAELLRLYDDIMQKLDAKGRPSAKRLVAENLMTARRQDFQSAEAIEQQIRRLLKKRRLG